MRIGIVNDLALAVETLRRAVLSVPGQEVAWIARDGQEAVKRCAVDRPDVVLMDLIMPVMDGVEATRRIMRDSPCPILLVTATVTGNFTKVYEAMGCGALDAVNTPVLDANGTVAGHAELIRKISQVAASRRAALRVDPPTPLRMPRADNQSEQVFQLVAIGSSTGGPQALGDVLSAIPASASAAIVIVQHIAQDFAGGLATWLGQRSKLPVSLATRGMRIEPGRVYLAGTNDHLVLKPPRSFDYTAKPEDNPMRPSVDVFFNSLAENWVRPGIAAVLTGMGRDGAAGLLRLKQRGWHTIAQDAASCVVAGMPVAAAQAGAARVILPLREIGPAIAQRLSINSTAKS
jgi:two-component system response regulator WspF